MHISLNSVQAQSATERFCQAQFEVCEYHVQFLMYTVYMGRYSVVERYYVEILTDLHVFSTPTYDNPVYMRKYCDVEKYDLEILTDLWVFKTPWYERVVAGIASVHVYMYVCTYICTHFAFYITYICVRWLMNTIFVLVARLNSRQHNRTEHVAQSSLSVVQVNVTPVASPTSCEKDRSEYHWIADQ